MIRGYANRGSADRGYIGAIAELLCQYPRSLALECADPLHGVVLTTKFMPTPADIAGWMEPRVEVMKGRADWEDGAERQLRERREYAERVFRPRETYDELKARYGENWGLSPADRDSKRYRWFTLEEMRGKFGAEKVDAVPAANEWKKLKNSIARVTEKS